MKCIEIDGKQFPCRITMGAMLRFRRETGHDVSAMKSDDLGDLVVFLWCCTASACNADGVDFNYGLDDFADRLDPEGINRFYADVADTTTTEKKTKGQTS